MLKGILLFITEHILKGAFGAKRQGAGNWHSDHEMQKMLNTDFLFSHVCFCRVTPAVSCLFRLVVYDSPLAACRPAFYHSGCHFSPPASVGTLKPGSLLIPLLSFQGKCGSRQHSSMFSRHFSCSAFPDCVKYQSQVLQTQLSWGLYHKVPLILEKHPPFHPRWKSSLLPTPRCMHTHTHMHEQHTLSPNPY